MKTAGQDALFTELYDAYSQPLYRYLYHLVGDVAHAEELLQDVFMRAYRALPRVDAGANYRAWLYQIATNAARDWFRRQSVRRWLPLERERAQDAEPLEESLASDEPALPVEERLAVRDALRELPGTYRTPLILFAVEGFSTTEIAAVLGISRSAVKMRLLRARLLFQSAYGVCEREGASASNIAQEPGSLSRVARR